MRRVFILLATLLGACVSNVPMSGTERIAIRGTEQQIAALLNDKEVTVGPSVKLLSDEILRGGRRKLTYQTSPTTPYREIGGLVFYAQRHGNKVKFEKAP